MITVEEKIETTQEEFDSVEQSKRKTHERELLFTRKRGRPSNKTHEYSFEDFWEERS